MGNRRSIGGPFTDLLNCDGSADEFSVDPASDGSRSNRLNKISTGRKLRALRPMNGI